LRQRHRGAVGWVCLLRSVPLGTYWRSTSGCMHAQLAGDVRDRPAWLLGAPKPHCSLL
jgi:hypothetical protein